MHSFSGRGQMSPVNKLKDRVNHALKQPNRRNFRSAMNFLIEKRKKQFDDDEYFQNLRLEAHNIKQNVINNQAQLLLKLESKLKENGIKVHWASNATQANQIIYQILNHAKVKSVVKGKSMVTEEIGLNQFLSDKGIEITESDLGEFIVQLAKETPSHIVMPAIHKSKAEIAKILHQHFPQYGYTEDVKLLTQIARNILRDKFQNADAGISGVNFLVVETGTMCLVENEGNGRLSTSVPPLHIAVSGIEKLVEKLTDVPPLLELLTKSATGQEITTYFNMISRPRIEGEKDGPKEVHLVLLDNGRTQISANKADILSCIRCGSCINHCPVYVQIGGHAYGTVYPGPIGIALEPMLQGLDKQGELISACTLCGKCNLVCPMKIPLTKIIKQLRFEAVNSGQIKGAGSQTLARIAWYFWQLIYRKPVFYRLTTFFICKLRFLTPKKLGAYSKYRNISKPAKTPMRSLVRQHGFDYE